MNIPEIVISAVMAVLGFLLKTVHSDVRRNTESVGKLKGKMDLVEQSTESKIDKLTTVTEMQIQQLTAGIQELTNSVSHLNGNFKAVNEGTNEILTDILFRLDQPNESK